MWKKYHGHLLKTMCTSTELNWHQDFVTGNEHGTTSISQVPWKRKGGCCGCARASSVDNAQLNRPHPAVASQAQALVVFQPSLAEGIEGDSITMRCSYSTRSEPKVGSYRWMKDSVVAVKNHTREFLGRVTLTSDQDFLSGRRADIEIQDLRHYDSGTYRCVVDIPGLPETTGNGTVLRVIKPAAAPKAPRQEDYMNLVWLLLRAIFCAFGITTVALVTRLYYEKTMPQMDQSGPRCKGKNKCQTARGT